MSMRAFNEGARALVLWTAMKADVSHRSDNDADRRAAQDHLGLMTPIVKGVLTDTGFENTVKAQQIFGGHGYIAEWGMEQFVRDARIAMLYEGANGIQAMDLVGRKLGKDGGRAALAFFNEVTSFLKESGAEESLADVVKPVETALGHLQQATMWFMQNALARPDHAGAGATDYMHMFGLVALAYMWVRIVKAAQTKLTAGDHGETARMEGKIATARFFMQRMLPETGAQLARITSGADSVMALAAEAF